MYYDLLRITCWEAKTTRSCHLLKLLLSKYTTNKLN